MRTEQSCAVFATNETLSFANHDDLPSALRRESRHIGTVSLGKRWLTVLATLCFCIFNRHSLGQNLTAPASVVPTVVVSGNLQWLTNGGFENGTLSLKITPDGHTEEVWNLLSVQKSVVQTSFVGTRTCTTTQQDGTILVTADMTCFHPIPWFAPWLVSQSLYNSLTGIVDLTNETDKTAGTVVKRISILLNQGLQNDPLARAHLDDLSAQTAVVVTKDLASGNIARMDYIDHVAGDTARQLKIHIMYTDYRSSSGLMVPHHIER